MFKVQGTQPDLIQRECGGWLAVSSGDGPRIAVTADNEQDAEARFAEAEAAWDRLRRLAAEREAG